MFANVSEALIEKIKRPEYRKHYVSAKVKALIAEQIHVIRKQNGMSQADLADKMGTSQSVVSNIEDPDYGRTTVSTLLKAAWALDVAVLVKFVNHASFLEETADLSREALQVAKFSDSMVDSLKLRISTLSTDELPNLPYSFPQSKKAMFRVSYSVPDRVNSSTPPIVDQQLATSGWVLARG